VIPLTPKETDPITHQIIEHAIAVHAELGPGLLERPYLIALAMALRDAGMPCEMEKAVPIVFRGRQIGDYRPDLIVASHVVVEIKSVERYDPVFLAQMLTYLRVTRLRVGLIINFNRPKLVDGLKRVVL
jgi:GxxExxY protein